MNIFYVIKKLNSHLLGNFRDIVPIPNSLLTLPLLNPKLQYVQQAWAAKIDFHLPILRENFHPSKYALQTPVKVGQRFRVVQMHQMHMHRSTPLATGYGPGMYMTNM